MHCSIGAQQAWNERGRFRSLASFNRLSNHPKPANGYQLKKNIKPFALKPEEPGDRSTKTSRAI